MAKRRAGTSGSGRRRSRPARTTGDVGLVLRYIESSALLAALLERDVTARAAIQGPGRRISSSLTLAEAARTVIRARVTGRINASEERAAVRALQTFARRCDVMTITDAVLIRVGRPFPVEPIRTLDAVHLATAEQLGEPPALVTIVTRDAWVRENALALGYAVE